MSQNIFDDIDPAVTSGNQLATLLNEFKDAVVSGFSGTSRPTNLQTYGYWVDTTNIGSNIFSFKIYDGTTDVEVFQVNTATGGIIITGSEDVFQINKTGEDSIGSELKLSKERDLNNGQILAADEIGKVNFIGKDDTGVERIQARIISVSTDNVTSSVHGSYMSLLVTETGTNTLSEAMRILGDGKVGVGTSAPETTFEVRGQDDDSAIKSTRLQDTTEAARVITRKQRATGLGQTLDNDEVGEFVVRSTDDAGNEIDAFRVVAIASEDHTAANQGTGFKLQAKDNGSNSFVDVISYENGVIAIAGQQNTDAEESVDLLDDSVTRELLSVDGTIYGSFIAEIMITGRDVSETRQQKLLIEGIYDENNTEWTYEVTNKIIKGSDKVVVQDVPSVAVSTLVINYVNQFAQVDFTDGRIMKKIRRFLK